MVGGMTVVATLAGGVAALSTVCQRGTSSPHHKISPYGLPVAMVRLQGYRIFPTGS